MDEGLVERVARKVCWPDEEETRRGLALYRTEFHRIMKQVRKSLGEFQTLADRFPTIQSVVVPDRIDELLPGARIEVAVRVGGNFSSDSTHTNPLMALCSDTFDRLVDISEDFDRWERDVDEIEESTRTRLLEILNTAQASTLEAMEERLDAVGRPPFEISPRRGFDESAGLRQTLLAYLPNDLGQALGVLTSYLYDQALEAGDAPGNERYIEREFRALSQDLAYLSARFQTLAEAGEHVSLEPSDHRRLEAATRLATALREAHELVGNGHD